MRKLFKLLLCTAFLLGLLSGCFSGSNKAEKPKEFAPMPDPNELQGKGADSSQEAPKIDPNLQGEPPGGGE